MTFPHGAAHGPTSLLLRFDSTDKRLGPNADDFFGYECVLCDSQSPPSPLAATRTTALATWATTNHLN
eukprot:SAG22_NODE_56_length_23716_cov_11.146759_8_plen_68_part_00